MSNLSLREKSNSWRYLGYSKELLAKYDGQIARDNLCILKGALIVAFINTLIVILPLSSGSTARQSSNATFKLMMVTLLCDSIVMLLYFRSLKSRKKAAYSRWLTIEYDITASLFHLPASRVCATGSVAYRAAPWRSKAYLVWAQRQS